MSAASLEDDVANMIKKHFDLVMPKVQKIAKNMLMESLKGELGKKLESKSAGGSSKNSDAKAPLLEEQTWGAKSQGETPQPTPRTDGSEPSPRTVSVGKHHSDGYAPLTRSRTSPNVTHLDGIDLSKGDEVHVNTKVDLTGEEIAEQLHVPKCIRPHAVCLYDFATGTGQVLREPARTGCLFNFLEGPLRGLGAVVIFVNGVEAALAANYEAQHGEGQETPWIAMCETCFLAFYTLELTIAICVHRGYFFVNDNWLWNNFDLLIVLQSMYERGSKLVEHSRHGTSMSFMRTFRLLRVVKALRALKFIRFFRSLRLMLESVANSVSSLFGMITMIFFIFYISSLIVLQGVTVYFDQPETDPDMTHLLQKYYGSVSLAMVSFFMCFIGGANWDRYYRLMEALGESYRIAFLCFSMFINVVVVNIMTGILLENVLKLSEPDPDQVAREWAAKEKKIEEEILRICTGMDRDRTGTISWSEFKEYVQDPHIAAHFAALDLDVNHAEMFFKTLCVRTDKDEVEISTFVEGCARMKGRASSIDLHILSIQVQSVQEKMEFMMKELTEKIDQLDDDDDDVQEVEDMATKPAKDLPQATVERSGKA